MVCGKLFCLLFLRIPNSHRLRVPEDLRWNVHAEASLFFMQSSPNNAVHTCILCHANFGLGTQRESLKCLKLQSTERCILHTSDTSSQRDIVARAVYFTVCRSLQTESNERLAAMIQPIWGIVNPHQGWFKILWLVTLDPRSIVNHVFCCKHSQFN